MQDVKPSSQARAEVYDVKEESTLSIDFASPVASFFKESKRQIEQYFRGNTNEIEINNVKKETYLSTEGKKLKHNPYINERIIKET